MPLATLHLLQLGSGKKASEYLRALKASSVQPIVAARVVRWIIKPETISVGELLEPTWDLFLVLSQPLPEAYLGRDWVTKHWTMTVGIPSRVINGFEERNAELLHPREVPRLTGSMDKPRIADSSQGLELSPELLEWSHSFKQGAVSMLNLLAFKPGADESYKRYGKAFAESIGARRGGNAKLVGKVVGESQWEEFALAHYPSIEHFVDMIASADYQEVNHRDRLPSLKDTCILCTSELDPEVYSDRSKL